MAKLKPVVLICGFTGSGKTTILQSILGKKLVPDDKIEHEYYEKYENEHIRIYDSKGLEPDRGEDHFIQETKIFIRKKEKDENVDNHIHVFWYVIQGCGGRVTDTDFKIINIFPKESTVVLISKKDITKPQQLDVITKRLIDSGISSNKIIAVDESGDGMKKLMSLTNGIMSKIYIKTNPFYFNEEEMMRDFGQKYKEEVKKIPKPVVLICGYTGSGKSTILQGIFGKYIVSDDKIGDGERTTQDYNEYENCNIRIYDSKGLEPECGEDHFISSTKKFIRKKEKDENVDNHIHIFWYVIQGSGARVTDTDLKIINIFPKESTVVVISKKDIIKPQQLDAITKKLLEAEIPKDRIIAVAERQKGEEIGEGIESLDRITREIMPEAYKAAWDKAVKISKKKEARTAQKIDLEKNLKAIKNKEHKAFAIINSVIEKRRLELIKNKEDKAFAIIAGASIAAGAAGAIPIPGSDAPIITATQVGMIASLAALYKVPMQKEQVLPMLMPLAGKQLATSLLKFIPVAGSIVSAGVAVTLTGGIGFFVQNQFEKIAIAEAKGEEPPSLIFDASIVSDFIENNKDLIKSVTKK